MDEFVANKDKEFEEYCYEIVRQHIEAIDPTRTALIYALSFFIYDESDEPDRPTLTLGYNTLEQLEERAPSPLKDSPRHGASDRDEAKWNYAFWLQNKLCVIGQEGTESETLRDEWIDSLMPHYDQTQSFVNICVRVSRRLHKSGIILQKFGREIPVIVHELEYYDEIAHQTSAANPDGLADEFVDWVFNLGV